MSSTTYKLTMRQEPKHSRFCTSPTDRRPIDPPPIIQLHIGGSNADSWHLLQNPNYFMFVSLIKPDATDVDQELHWLQIEDSDGTQRAPTRFTTGAVVSSLHILKDPENGQRRGGFFVFPDLGVRAEGKYRLKCTLYEVVDELLYRNHIFSCVFEVYQSRKFPGMQKSTPLSCSFSEQGIKIWIRKNVRERRVPALDRSPRIVEAQVPKPPRKRARTDQQEDVKKKTERSDKSKRHTPMLESPPVSYVAPTPSISDTFPLPPGYAAPPQAPSLHQHRRDQAQGRSRMSIGNLLNAADPPRLESR
ncbi:hypothetical protein BDZ89DRAFT_259396 [Hymenopellis radicata]|nr:hypothetical protein BDZ89DRAFT_259396 [Hymenopellis radicata]